MNFLPFLQVAAGISAAAYIVPAVISAAVAVGSSIYSAINTKRNNETMLDYNKSMTQSAWERDDKYFQRSVADAEAAGLSPLAVNGAMPNSAPLSAPNLGQAPQFDMNSLIQAFSAMGQTEETKRHNIASEDATKTKLEQDAQKIKLEADKLNLEDKKLEQQIKYQADLIALENNKLAEIKLKDASEYELKSLAYVQDEIRRQISEQTGGKNIPVEEYTDPVKFEVAWTLWTSKYQAKIAELGKTSEGQGTSNSSNWNASAGAGVPLVAQGNLSGGSGSSESQYTVENNSQKIDYGMEQFYLSNHMPVLITVPQTHGYGK